MDEFTVIADPTRRRIIDTLRAGAADVGTLVTRLHISQSLFSKHLAALRSAGTVVLAWVTPYHRVTLATSSRSGGAVQPSSSRM